ncbi:MAG: Cysteine desulfuration protein SufE [Verrucomicrobia subdivision 3 bacterium]|nr:Cysteine desulfuration protein SufE [Limisphaerales bacterium]MCS1415691.1 Cysteine desulfuration protein SufE [Limisphaerales bacterium]
MTIEDLIENFELLEDWDDRYAYLMELGRKMPSMDQADKIEENRVKGCQATVWLKETIVPGPPQRIEFLADSNSQIVKGLVAMLRLLYSGKTPQEILDVNAKDVFTRLGLHQHLSPTRSTGLNSMVKTIRALAELSLA